MLYSCHNRRCHKAQGLQVVMISNAQKLAYFLNKLLRNVARKARVSRLDRRTVSGQMDNIENIDCLFMVQNPACTSAIIFFVHLLIDWIGPGCSENLILLRIQRIFEIYGGLETLECLAHFFAYPLDGLCPICRQCDLSFVKDVVNLKEQTEGYSITDGLIKIGNQFNVPLGCLNFIVGEGWRKFAEER